MFNKVVQQLQPNLNPDCLFKILFLCDAFFVIFENAGRILDSEMICICNGNKDRYVKK